MKESELKQMDERIRNASPLELAKVLNEAELFDKKTSREVVDEVYKEFQNSNDLVEKLVIPIFTSVADGLLEATSATRAMRKKGLTATRLVQECRAFSYSDQNMGSGLPDGYTEWKNMSERTKADFKKYGDENRASYDRSLYEDKDRLNEYKNQRFNENGGRINATDEYTNKKNVYRERTNPDGRRNIEQYKHSHQAEVDHIVPLEKIHEQFKGNYALTDADIKNIANKDSNYALTSAHINRGEGYSGKGSKGKMTNEEFIADQRERERTGRPNQGLTEAEKQNMLSMGKEAQKQLERDANSAIFSNITGRGTGKSSEIIGKTAGNAASQSKDYAVGNVILYLIKPLYYEISDILKNGLKDGVNATSVSEAFKIRFNRIKNYLYSNLTNFIGTSIWDFIKGFISSLIEGIIGLFIGIFRQILKVIKEGIKIFVNSCKILFGKESKNMSAAEKGDAITKILGTGIIAICGVGIEALLNRIGIMAPWSIVLSTILSGIASALFMYLLDEIDLFSVKAERRKARIEEIFNERIKDIKEAEATYNLAALETMRSQRLQFDSISMAIHNGIEHNNIDIINKGLYSMASFFGVDLGYKNTDEFVNYFDGLDTIEL